MPGFGKRLKEAIKDSGLPMAQVAIRAGLKSPGHVRAMVEELTEPKIGNVAKVAAVLGVTLDWLVTGEPPKRRRQAVAAGSLDELADAVYARIQDAHPVRVEETHEREIRRPKK